MCILFWTLPTFNHPRFKLDELLDRETTPAAFWDIDSILHKAQQTANNGDTQETEPPHCNIGILSGQDIQPSTAINYMLHETRGDGDNTLSISTKDIPGTWLGITTHGHLVALTNYREAPDYVIQTTPPKLSRGKVCGEYLVSMAALHSNTGQTESLSRSNKRRRICTKDTTMVRKSSNGHSNGHSTTFHPTSADRDQAEHWIRRRARGWENEFEGLNLLVVQDAGEKQCIGGNRNGSGLTIYQKGVQSADAKAAAASGTFNRKPPSSFVTGVSNSVYARPWVKIDKGLDAFGNVLNRNLDVFGTEACAYLQMTTPDMPTSETTTTTTTTTFSHTSTTANANMTKDDGTLELAWMVLETLKMMKSITKPVDMATTPIPSLETFLREQVYIPKIHFGHPDRPYGTRSSTIVLFGRESNIAVYAEKSWYGPLDKVTGARPEYSVESADGLVWWQGPIGQSPRTWKRIQGKELQDMLDAANRIPSQ
ncbi:hypothetical protein BGZ94_004141 [Podila epigama]|nr:hypothetical protein BGZ94_004141 [Podila epigama]